MKIVDLFCGCGGMSMGFGLAGHEVAVGFDNWDKAIDVYRANFGHPVLKADLKNVEESVAAILPYAPDMIIGGPPCQDFSSAGKRDEDGGRGDLTVCYAEIVAKVRPRFFVMENVARIVKTQKLVEAKDIFRSAGYALSQYVLDASLCGVPQARKRFVLVGTLDAYDKFLIPFIERKLARKPMTVKDYFGEEIDFEFYYRHPRSYVRRGIFSVNEPSPTIRGVNRPMPKGYPLHPGDPVQSLEGIRNLTTGERARIQTFPKDFHFLGNKTDQEQMIGNAVPVNLAKFVGEAIQDYIDFHLNPCRQVTSKTYATNKEPIQLTIAMEPQALYLSKAGNKHLIGSCRQGNRAWVKENRLYNYPVADEELECHPQLLKVSELTVMFRKKADAHYSVESVEIVTRQQLAEMGYPVKSSHHKADAKYLLYHLGEPSAETPTIDLDAFEPILGKGVKK